MAVAVFDINEQVAKAKAAELQARGAQAQALAFGVTVNCVAPGFVVSDMTLQVCIGSTSNFTAFSTRTLPMSCAASSL
jgi:NAD(P)-dependent dehydrogenase (short-subunit alcohol dehydrogenase family)